MFIEKPSHENLYGLEHNSYFFTTFALSSLAVFISCWHLIRGWIREAQTKEHYHPEVKKTSRAWILLTHHLDTVGIAPQVDTEWQKSNKGQSGKRLMSKLKWKIEAVKTYFFWQNRNKSCVYGFPWESVWWNRRLPTPGSSSACLSYMTKQGRDHLLSWSK